MVIALEHDVLPRKLGLGAAAGVLSMIKRRDNLQADIPSLPSSAAALNKEALARLLLELWGDHPAAQKHGQRLISLTWDGVVELSRLGLTG